MTAIRVSMQPPRRDLTRDEAATVYITGFGPTDTHYVDATADPRRP
jgi:hypothetical protein